MSHQGFSHRLAESVPARVQCRNGHITNTKIFYSYPSIQPLFTTVKTVQNNNLHTLSICVNVYRVIAQHAHVADMPVSGRPAVQQHIV